MKISCNKNEGRTIQSWFQFPRAVGNAAFNLSKVAESLRKRFNARVDTDTQDKDYIVAVVGTELYAEDIRWCLDNLPPFSHCSFNGPAYV